MRGYHKSRIGKTTSRKGSSPLARVPRLLSFYQNNYEGIIPACAGTTDSWSDEALENEDHPRLRGYHFIGAFAIPIKAGSSPLARVPLEEEMEAMNLYGIIPACAGTTI